jgi:uncharacterized protein YxjI
MKYYIKEKVFTLTRKFTVYNAYQEEVFFIEGELFNFKNKINMYGPEEDLILYTERKLFSFLPEYTIYLPNGESVASIKRKFSFRPTYEVFEGNNDISVDGNYFGHSFTVYKNGQIAASIVKQLFTFGDAYEIDVVDTDNDLLYLFIVIVIDQVAQAAQNAN